MATKLNNETEIYMDYALIFGQKVERPKRVSVIRWYQIWDEQKKDVMTKVLELRDQLYDIADDVLKEDEE